MKRFIIFFMAVSAGIIFCQNNEPDIKERLKNHATKLTIEFHPRNTIENLNKTADYIKEEFKNSGGRVDEQKYDYKNNTYRNIIVHFGTANSKRIVVAAHYDSHKDSPGADDNASGVAALIEIARLLGKSKFTNLSIELAALATEEVPFFRREEGMGSIVHAKSLKRNNTEVELVIILDQLGYFSNEEDSQKFIFPGQKEKVGSTKGNFIALIGGIESVGKKLERLEKLMKESTNLPIYSQTIPKEQFDNNIPCDVTSYTNLGYPALIITDTAPYRGKHRHTAEDNIQVINFSAIKAAVISLTSAIVNIQGEL